MVWGPHPGIDGMGGLFWSILHNANVFFHHIPVPTRSISFLDWLLNASAVGISVLVGLKAEGPSSTSESTLTVMGLVTGRRAMCDLGSLGHLGECLAVELF